MSDVKYAFRCKGCGHLQGPDNAGDNSVPAACVCCGKGVVWGQGTWAHDPNNWQILATMKPEELAEFGLKPENVVVHEPSHEKGHAENLNRAKESHAFLVAKESHWEKTKKMAPKEVFSREDKIAQLEEKCEAFLGHSNDPALVKMIHEIDKLKLEIEEIKNTEWTERDAKHKAELENTISMKGAHAPGKPKSVFASVREGMKMKDRA